MSSTSAATPATTPASVRDAGPADAPACAAIYAPYVTGTVVSFEAEPPDADEMARRIAQSRVRHAWLVAERDGEVVGYAYAVPFASRPAYRWTCEVSVYVDRGRRAAGVGRLLYAALLDRLRERGFRVAIAKVSQPNDASNAFHERFGFTRVGLLPAVGYKHDAWHDIALLQLELAPREGRPPETV